MEVHHFSTKGKEREFAEAAKHGDSVAFKHIRRMTLTRGNAEDVVQEAFSIGVHFS